MKKLFTVFLALAAVLTLSAQTAREEARRVILGSPNKGQTSRNGGVVYDRNGYPTYPGSYGSGQAEIDRINREYDAKIYSIRTNPNLTEEEKQRMISRLERDRQRKIREINNRYRNDGYDDDDYRKDRKYKYKERKDNGRHLGWQKGKGNPHRTGEWPGNSGKAKGKRG